MSVEVRFLGSGDSWGSGGRFQTCILVDGDGYRLLLDCGASSLIAMRAQGIEPNTISAVLLTHFHGDHCGGVAFLLMDAMLGSKRQAPLTILGPPGIEERMQSLRRTLFPGSEAMVAKFPLRYREIRSGEVQDVDGVSVTAYAALHTPETMPSMLRVKIANKVVVYTGDTDWTSALVDAADGADLLISECYFFDKPIKMHMTYATLRAHRHQLRAKKIVLTHMSADMLKHVTSVAEECAFDGMVLSL